VADEGILARISELVEEERSMRAGAGAHGLRRDDQARLDKIEVALDQCWDLLNQRRALREFGEDPDQAQVRDEAIVESYEQ
jgi:hypothetical protein